MQALQKRARGRSVKKFNCIEF